MTKGHTLIIPKRHISSYFELSAEEKCAVDELVTIEQSLIMQADSTVTGFNIGINVGESAGQTVFHCHLHLIPRRNCDVDDPRGGVRGVIPDKQKY